MDGSETQARLLPLLEKARSNWGWFVLLGAVLLIMGVLVVGQSVLFTMASMMLIGVAMMVGGVAHVIAAFRGQGWRHFLVWLLGGALYLLAGLAVIANPLLASGVLTLMVAVALILAGIARIWMGLAARPDSGWGWLAAGGLLTLLLGGIIASGWPVNSLWLIGMFLGVDLIMQGWSYVMLGLALRIRR